MDWKLIVGDGWMFILGGILVTMKYVKSVIEHEE